MVLIIHILQDVLLKPLIKINRETPENYLKLNRRFLGSAV